MKVKSYAKDGVEVIEPKGKFLLTEAVIRGEKSLFESIPPADKNSA